MTTNYNITSNRSALSNASLGSNSSNIGDLGNLFNNFLSLFTTNNSNGLNNEAIATRMNSYGEMLNTMKLSDSQKANLMNSEYFRIQNDPMYKNTTSTLGNLANVAQTIGNVLGVGQAGFNLYSSIDSYSDKKRINAATLENMQLNNTALRDAIKFRQSEIDRLNRIRSNVNRQVSQSNAVKTSY